MGVKGHERKFAAIGHVERSDQQANRIRQISIFVHERSIGPVHGMETTVVIVTDQADRCANPSHFDL